MVVTDTSIDIDEILKFACTFAKNNRLEIPKKGWLSFVKKDHPHYTVVYRDFKSMGLKHLSFTYTDSITEQCNSKCNSIW